MNWPLLAFSIGAWLAASMPPGAEDVLARSRTVYASLRSYADTGSISVEYGPPGAVITERHTFKTFYRAPRNFLFEFVKEAAADRFVVWSDGTVFRTWWAATGVADTYPQGRGTEAFAIGAVPTANTLTYTAPLLFSAAGLAGALTELGDATIVGTESVSGRQCQKVSGVAKSVYAATGNVNVRTVIVWVDNETALVRKIVEDASGTPAGNTSRSTVTLDPQANPTLDDAKFRFTPPSR
jgi:outer membrane lipoprotein-sorting protein